MYTYVITRANGWANPDELKAAGARSATIGNEEMPDKVRWIRSYVTRHEGGRVGTVCIYQATDPEAIRVLHDIRAKRSDVVATTGLDQHDGRRDCGLRVVLTGPEPDPLAALRAGRFINVGSRISLDSDANLTRTAMTGLWILRWLVNGANRARRLAACGY